MNPLQELKNLVAGTNANMNGTVVGMQGTLVQIRTAQGIQLVNSDKVMARGSIATVDTNGKVLSVLETDDSIPTYRV